MKVVVVGGGIAGLAAARKLEELLPDTELVLVEREARLGGKVVTERSEGLVVEGAADSFLSRKERGIGLCEELGLGGELVGRRPENARSFVRLGSELVPLPEGLTGLVPTDLDALARSALLTDEGRVRVAAERDVPPQPRDGDESVAAFVTRRLGREAYERIVEPLVTGIYGGDGHELSLEATFPQLRALELEHGSLLRGLAEQLPPAGEHPPFVSLRGGMGTLVAALAGSLERTDVVTGHAVSTIRHDTAGLEVALAGGDVLHAAGVVLAVPAHAASHLLLELDGELAELHAAMPHTSSVVVTLAFRAEEVGHRLDGYGYVVPSVEGSEVLACTWSSSKWEGRAPEDSVLLRVFAGRQGHRDLTGEDDALLVALARAEVGVLGIDAEPWFSRVHRWPRGMPQYVLGHPERLERIDEALERHPGLALAGAAYRGVGIPDCIDSGEHAARGLAGVTTGASR